MARYSCKQMNAATIKHEMAGFSTETAILCVISDILAAVDSGDFAALVLLDLST
jgi:hypothetical protein